VRWLPLEAGLALAWVILCFGVGLGCVMGTVLMRSYVLANW
jgi:hypothetical protein